LEKKRGQEKRAIREHKKDVGGGRGDLFGGAKSKGQLRLAGTFGKNGGNGSANPKDGKTKRGRVIGNETTGRNVTRTRGAR